MNMYKTFYTFLYISISGCVASLAGEYGEFSWGIFGGARRFCGVGGGGVGDLVGGFGL